MDIPRMSMRCTMTIKEIAKLAGVSISTVSKIVNNKDANIHPETRNRVLKIVKEYNYTPYGTVKNISTAKTFILGILLKNLAGCEPVLAGIIHKAQEKGYCVIPMDSQDSLEDELKHITALCKNKVDGVLWEPVDSESLDYEHYFAQSDIPVCYFNSPWAGADLQISYEKLGYLCTKALLGRGHTKIGCLIHPEARGCQSFLDGFKSCLFDAGIPFQEDMVCSQDNSLQVTPERYTGVLCHCPDDAWRLYQRLYAQRCHIPADLSIVTTGALPASGPISAYGLPLDALGLGACEKLIALCEKNAADVPPLTYTLNNENSLGSSPDCCENKLVVLGSINADITFIVDGQIQTGKSAVITDSSSIAGGKGPNQAVAAARLGHRAVLLGKVGNDPEARLIFDILDQEKLPTEGIGRVFDAPTGKAYIYLQKDGEGATTYLPGANLSLSDEDISEHSQLFKGCTYCLLSTDIPMNAVLRAAAIAREKSVKTIVKPSAMNELPEELYEKTDIFIPNQAEAETFCPKAKTPEEAAEYFYNKGIPTVIITLGSKGCYLKTREICRHFPAPDFPAADTTGGADAMIAALACYLSDGYPLEKAIPIAQYAAGFCISHQGVTPSLVDRKTLHAYIAKKEPGLL